MQRPSPPLQLEQALVISRVISEHYGSDSLADEVRKVRVAFAERRDLLFPDWQKEYEKSFEAWHASFRQGSPKALATPKAGTALQPTPMTTNPEPQKNSRTSSITRWELTATSITNKSEFIADMGLDSLDFVEVILSVEEEFGVDIPDEDAEKLDTFGRMITYIESYEDRLSAADYRAKLGLPPAGSHANQTHSKLPHAVAQRHAPTALDSMAKGEGKIVGRIGVRFVLAPCSTTDPDGACGSCQGCARWPCQIFAATG